MRKFVGTLLLLLLLFSFSVSAKKVGRELPPIPKLVENNGIKIEADKSVYYCSEYISKNECIVRAKITIENRNTQNFYIEDRIDFSTNIKQAEFKDVANKRIPKTEIQKANKKAYKLSKRLFKKNEKQNILVEFVIDSSGKFDYTVDVKDTFGNILFTVVLDPYYEFYYQSSDGSKEDNYVIETDSLNNIYALGIASPFNLSTNESLNFSFCIFSRIYNNTPKAVPIVAIDYESDGDVEVLSVLNYSKQLSNIYDWNCWENITYVHECNSTITQSVSKLYFGFVCTNCGINSSDLIKPLWDYRQDIYNNNPRTRFSVWNTLNDTITYLNITISVKKRPNETLITFNPATGFTNTNLSNSTHFVFNSWKSGMTWSVWDTKTWLIRTDYDLDEFHLEPKLIINDVSPTNYDAQLNSILIGLDTNGVPQNLSYVYNSTSNSFKAITDGNLLMALDFGELNPVDEGNITCNETWVKINETACNILDYKNVTYNHTLTNCSWEIEVYSEGCDYCEPDWQPLVVNGTWECMNINGSYLEYHTYFDYAFCYNETSLFTDSCDYYFDDCGMWVECELYPKDFNCTFNSEPYIERILVFLCELPVGDWYCYSYVRKENNILQTNPEPEINFLIDLDKNDKEKYFRNTGRILKPYITKKNLLPKNTYVLGVKCADNSSQIITWEQEITPVYKPANWALYRGEWVKNNIVVIIGIGLIVVLLIAIISYIKYQVWK